MTEYVITLIADLARKNLTQALVEKVSAAINAERVEWIKEDIACDLHWDTDAVNLADIASAMTLPALGIVGMLVDWSTRLLRTDAADRRYREICQLLQKQGIDVIPQVADHRRKKLLICDMDSTMITVECIDELADFVGKKPEVAAITERAMNGELDFAAALTARVALLEGLPESALQECYDARVRFSPGARELVQGMRAAGAHTVLVSGGFTFFTARVAEALGFHAHYANVLEVAEGKLTGRVVPPILGKEAKLATLQRYVAELGITTDDVLAVGDGANDLPMLLAAGLGVAYRAKPSVQAAAHHRLNSADLRALLWAQGLG